MKIKKLIHFYSSETLQKLELLACEGGYTTLTSFLNAYFKNIAEQESVQALNAHFSPNNNQGSSLGVESNKRAKNSLESGKE